MSNEYAIIYPGERLADSDARHIHRFALQRASKMIILDLHRVGDATTSAFATLVLLRRELLRKGRDLRLRGLRERAARVYQFCMLREVLPCESITPRAARASDADESCALPATPAHCQPDEFRSIHNE